MGGAELASPSVSAACSPPEVVTGLCSVHDAETYSAHSPMVSTHLGAHENKQQMEVHPFSLGPSSGKWDKVAGFESQLLLGHILILAVPLLS